MTDRPVVWCVSTSDSAGGAGLQADNAACRSFGVHPCHVVTGITAQSSLHITEVFALPAATVRAQISALSSDLPPAAIKIGALPGPDQIPALDALWSLGCPVVMDPVLCASTGAALAFSGFRKVLLDELLTRVALLTPNVPECEALTGVRIREPADMAVAADRLLERGLQAVVVKGGHLAGAETVDFYADRTTRFWLRGERVRTSNGHGTGCAFASAGAAALASGESPADAVVLARMYVHNGLANSYRAGAGAGPVAHAGWPANPASLPTLNYHPPSAWCGPPLPFPYCDSTTLGLYACLDSAAWIERALGLGIRTLQLRNKILEGDALEREARRAHALCENAGARLFINDHWQLAARIGAYGVHLGQEDLDSADLSAIRRAGLRLGISTHSWHELARAHGVRPSYLAFGPIFPTTTKTMGFQPQGLDRLRRWSRLADGYPQVAIGGIDSSNAAAVMAQGVGSICVVRAITQAHDPAKTVRDLQRGVGRAGTRSGTAGDSSASRTGK